MKTYSIGITTFSKRYDSFKKCIESIRKYNEHVKIIVAVNGETKDSPQTEYIKSFSELITATSNSYPIFFPEFRGVAKLFNTLSIFSNTDGICIINDDTEILNERFFSNLEWCVERSDLFKINGSFSHFYCDKKQLDTIGYFDERLLGIGEEDGDLTYRYIELYGKGIDDFHIPEIAHYHSYVRQEQITPGVGKYSKQNRMYMFSEKFGKYRQSTNEKDIVGMFGSPHTKVTQDINCYPYERNFIEHKNDIYEN